MVDGTTYVRAALQPTINKLADNNGPPASLSDKRLHNKQTKERFTCKLLLLYYQDVTFKHVFMMACKSRNKFRHRAIFIQRWLSHADPEWFPDSPDGPDGE